MLGGNILGAVVEKVYSAILWLSLYLVDTAIMVVLIVVQLLNNKGLIKFRLQLVNQIKSK